MSGSFLRNGGRLASSLLLRHSRTHPISGAPARLRPPPPPPAAAPSRSFGRSPLRGSKFRDSSSSPPVSPAASAVFSASSSSSSSASSAARNGFVSWYLGMIEARPVLTKSLTAGAIFTAADLSSQMITVSSLDSLDLIRTLRMAGYGVVLSGPSLHLWFNFVSRILPKRDVLNTLKKMFLGQALYGPIMTAVFFSLNAGLQGETGAEIFARLKRDLIPTLKSGLVYWPMCDFITFRFIPVRLQPLVSNSFSYLWTIYITYMASLQKASMEKISAT